MNVPRYLVTLATRKGVAELEVPTLLGPDAAARRARMVAIAQRWGDFDTVRVTACTLINDTPCGCECGTPGCQCSLVERDTDGALVCRCP